MDRSFFESPSAEEMTQEDYKVMLEDVQDLSDELLVNVQEYYDNSNNSLKGQVVLSAILSTAMKFFAMSAPCIEAARQRCDLLSRALEKGAESESMEEFYNDYQELLKEEENEKHDAI